MSLWHIAWSYLWNRKLTTCLTILSVALAVALIASVLTLREETKKRFEDDSQAFDVVVGAKGSALQLVLSSVYFMDAPTGNIPITEYEKIKNDKEYVQSAFPINLGDSYQRTFRIVGTLPELFQHTWRSLTTAEERAPFTLAEGSCFKNKMEAVLGASVARESGLKVGQEFISTHGMIDVPESMGGHSHANMPYKVVGILKPSGSPFDHAIYCSLDSVWAAHAHHEEHHDGETAAQHADAHETPAGRPDDDADFKEWSKKPESMVTAVLVQLQSPLMRFQYKEKIRDNTNVMAAIPIIEISNLYDQLLGTIKLVLLAVGYLVVAISALSILIGLYLSILQRKRDLAVMRALGASSYEIFGAVLIEAFWVTILGIIGGRILGNMVCYALGKYLAWRFGLSISAMGLAPGEIPAYAIVALVGVLAGFLPAWQAYHSDVARDLAER
jgi:putative ABC transport system permease protein